MTGLDTCPICGTARPADRGDGPWCCSIACYRSFHGIHQPEIPSCHDGVTMACPVCRCSFNPVGRQRYCGDPCRSAAYRRRRDAGQTPVVVPKGQPRKSITVYSCDGCGARAVGDQRCEECQIFMPRIGIGGTCPSCEEPISVNELLGEEVIV